MLDFNLAELARYIELARQRRWRLPLWLKPAARSLLPSLCSAWQECADERGTVQAAWLGPAFPAELPIAADWSLLHGQARQQALGRQWDLLIIDTEQGVDWDLVAATIGTVNAGGLWLIIAADPHAMQPNPQAKKVLSWPQQADQQTSRMHGWVAQQWFQHCTPFTPVLSCVGHWHPPHIDTQTIAGTSLKPSTALDQMTAATLDQAAAIDAIVRLHQTANPAPLVLTAHRGRGKSASLGLAAAQLYRLGVHRQLLCAPSPKAADVALQTAKDASHGLQPLHFYAIDRLLQQRPEADILYVDEAAAIPTPQLQQLVASYPCVVFATTEHGYEGTGRGFQLRFQQFLSKVKPGWQSLTLQTPIRYGSDDPLEQWSFRAFCLQTHEAPLSHMGPASPQLLDITDVWQNPTLLPQIFSLLALAHYQTRVRDLWALLEDRSLRLISLWQADALIGLCLVSAEGELPSTLAEAVARGERRVQGHLLAQSLAFHCQQPQPASLRCWRVQRLVIHPARQRQGYGQQLLSSLEQLALQHGVHYLGTSYGATFELVQFWQQHGYQPIRLGLRADQASGEYPLLMLKPLIEHCQITPLLVQQFRQQLSQQRQLDTHLPNRLFQLWSQQTSCISLTECRQALALYVTGASAFASIVPILAVWLRQQEDSPSLHSLFISLQQTPTDPADFIQQWQDVLSKTDMMHIMSQTLNLI